MGVGATYDPNMMAASFNPGGGQVQPQAVTAGNAPITTGDPLAENRALDALKAQGAPPTAGASGIDYGKLQAMVALGDIIQRTANGQGGQMEAVTPVLQQHAMAQHMKNNPPGAKPSSLHDESFTPKGVPGKTSETIVSDANGTRKTTIADVAPAGIKRSDAGSPPTSFGNNPGQAFANFPEPTPRELDLTGLSGLPVAVQMRIMEQENARHNQKDAVVRTVLDNSGNYVNIHASGKTSKTGIQGQTKSKNHIPDYVKGKNGNYWQKTSAGLVDSGIPFNQTDPNNMTELQRTNAINSVYDDVRNMQVKTDTKGKLHRQVVSDSQIDLMNKRLKLLKVDFTLKKINLEEDLNWAKNKHSTLTFKIPADGSPLKAADMQQQLMDTYGMDEDDAISTVKLYAKKQEAAKKNQKSKQPAESELYAKGADELKDVIKRRNNQGNRRRGHAMRAKRNAQRKTKKGR